MKVEDIRNIAIIGAGLMGHGLAQIFADKGFTVYLCDVKEEFLINAIENIKKNVAALTSHGIILSSSIDSIVSRIHTVVTMKEPAREAQFIIEAVSENLTLKQNIFRDLDSICPSQTLLATNTSVMSISEIASKSKGKDRIVGTHFWNPPYLIPLVEVVKGNETSNETVDTTYELLKNAGKQPVKVMKDVPGFIGNRLQHALWREAISIVQNGIADASAVDEVIKNGFGIRLPVLGPLENADMVGLDLTLAIHDYILKYIEASPDPSPILREKVNKGELGFKTGQGFFKWSENEIKQSRDRLISYLINWTKEQQKKQ